MNDEPELDVEKHIAYWRSGILESRPLTKAEAESIARRTKVALEWLIKQL